jgi:hypothetical protein
MVWFTGPNANLHLLFNNSLFFFKMFVRFPNAVLSPVKAEAE